MKYKLRFWHISEKMMFTDDQALLVSGMGHIFNAKSGMCVDTDYYKKPIFIAMLWTGLTDKNKKEIYKGDIVKSNSGTCFVVDWTHGGFYLRTLNNDLGEKIMFQKMDEQDYHVIGNIYENQELLK